MLKELVTSIFCCLPHHHEAPAPVVAERITPITVVSQEPYSFEKVNLALSEYRYRDVIQLLMRDVEDTIGKDFLVRMDELCEQFAQEGRYLSGTEYVLGGDDDPVKKGIILKYSISYQIGMAQCLIGAATKLGDKSLLIKALYWWLVAVDCQQDGASRTINAMLLIQKADK